MQHELHIPNWRDVLTHDFLLTNVWLVTRPATCWTRQGDDSIA
ncbi:hypothetical protein BN2497_8767 [Janthinobacterium sp. CG23_2]|nr:hypothetical protein BN2497_8767 [Janthinobacterium sp. CG23_2]CUU30781.1 hypothetical protein BN3177_8767 [Janthinobacterium sp. CG23_2]